MVSVTNPSNRQIEFQATNPKLTSHTREVGLEFGIRFIPRKEG